MLCGRAHPQDGFAGGFTVVSSCLARRSSARRRRASSEIETEQSGSSSTTSHSSHDIGRARPANSAPRYLICYRKITSGKLMRLSGWVRIGVVLSALWAVGASAYLAIFWRTSHESLHRMDWIFSGAYVIFPVFLLWGISSVSVVVVRWVLRGFSAADAGSANSEPVPRGLKGWKKAALIVASVLVLATYSLRHTGASDTDEFFSCNEQSINAFYAEQARKGASYDEAAQAGMEATSTDKCMSARGYEFMGGANGECMSARTNECYSRKWTTF